MSENITVAVSDLPHQYQVGQRVTYRGAWGRGEPKEAVITGLGFKNGKALYDLDDQHWCYEYQIHEVDGGQVRDYNQV